jgi:predicted metal-dependent phosphoesterase TrpH
MSDSPLSPAAARTVDLHTHSTASDGTLTPTQLVHAAHHAGLAAIALTDHDTGNGLDEALAAANQVGLKLVPGIEISADYPAPGTMHILGHFIDHHSPALERMSTLLLEARNERNPKIVERLNQLGCRITMEQVVRIAQDAAPAGATVVIGRPHVAKALVEAGCVSSFKQAFDVYLGTTGSAYFPKERLTPAQAISCIHDAGGLATLAHPIQLRTQAFEHLKTVLNQLADLGLDGLECIHCDHDIKTQEMYLGLAKQYALLPTGGSDFHGTNKADVSLGRGRNNVKVPYDWLEALEAKWQRRRHETFV